MAKHTIKGAVYAFVKDGVVHEAFTFNEYDLAAPFVKACDHTIEVDIPDDFDPRPAAVKMLQAEIDRARAECAERITSLQRQINSLTAIENAVEA